MEEWSDRGQRWMEGGEGGENGNNIKRTDACWGGKEGGRAAGGANTTLTRCDMPDQKHVTIEDTAIHSELSEDYESVQDVARVGRVPWSSWRASRFS